MFVGCEADPECFHVEKEAVVTLFAKAALNAGTEDELRVEAAEAPVRMAFLLQKAVTGDPQ